MRVLIVKTSSMGDVLHTLPALSDAALAFPGIRFDWVVEEGFAQIPSWHESVDRVIRWRFAAGVRRGFPRRSSRAQSVPRGRARGKI